MFRNYLKIAFRNLVKNKTFTLINLLGLSLGIAVSVLILMFVMHEVSYDKFHENKDRIYRVLVKFQMGDQTIQSNSFSARMGPMLQESTPSVESYVRIKPAVDRIVMSNPEKAGETFYEQNFMFADTSLFSVFTFPLVAGSASDLSRPFTMILSERAAQKYFGDQNPLGKSLLYEGKDLIQVVGIARNPPSNSSLNFDFVVSTATYPQLSQENKDAWENSLPFHTYLLLDSEQSVEAVTARIIQVGNKTGAFDMKADYQLESFAAGYLGNNFNGQGNAKLIYIFAGVTVLILLLALFNYMSLTAARATTRAREVGVRKVVGANRSSLVRQFYMESGLLCLVAFTFALVLVQVMQQPFYQLLGLHIDSSFLFSKTFLSCVVGLLVFSALAAGSYPALVLSGFAPLEVLKGRLAGGHSGAGVRRFFMVVQFTVSIVLIVCSMVVKNQLDYMQDKKLGLYKDQLLTIPITSSVASDFFPLRNEIRDLAGVQSVAASNAGFFKGYNVYFLKNFTDQKEVPLVSYLVDNQLIKTLQLDWSTPPAAKISGNRPYLALNETALKKLGIQGDPIGQKLGNDEVGGILKDFHFSSVQSEIGAMGLFVVSDTTNILKMPGGRGVLYVRLDPGANIQEKVATIGRIFKKYEKQKPFEYYFLDDAFNETFKTEVRMSTMFTVFTAFAIFIACMGLFGLVTFTAEARTREIGIRKVLGASVAGIVALLSRDFLKLVLVSVVVASPIAWYVMHRWLQDFAYQTDIHWWVFVLAGGLAVSVALLTVSFQSIKAALMNPVKSLRSE